MTMLYMKYTSFVSCCCREDFFIYFHYKKVQVGKDQEKAQSERDSHSKTEVGKNQTNNQALIP